MSILEPQFNERSEKYNPSKGWSSCAQPVADLNVQDYIELAEILKPELDRTIKAFCEQNKLSFIQIPQEVFRDEFEQTEIPFRQWLNEYCARHGLDKNASVAIIGPCVKPESSAQIKGKSTNADRIRDYLRTEIIVLTGSSPTTRTKSQSLNQIGNIIDSLENGQSVAWKNTLHEPKSHGYRDYKAIAVISDDSMSMLAEIKVDHESMQDAHRLTRKFMGANRTVDTGLAQFFQVCNSDAISDKIVSKAMHKVSGFGNTLGKLSREIYDTLYDRSGLNRFLSHDLTERHPSVPNARLIGHANEILAKIPSLSNLVMHQVQGLGLDTRKIKVPSMTL